MLVYPGSFTTEVSYINDGLYCTTQERTAISLITGECLENYSLATQNVSEDFATKLYESGFWETTAQFW